MSYNIFLKKHLSLLSFQSTFLHLQSFSMDKYKAIFHETLNYPKILFISYHLSSVHLSARYVLTLLRR